ncbi:hypothetical protein Hanom_Chr07g00681221 [Helianthus anomalus]
METGWILLPDMSPTLETFRKRPRRVPMVFLSPTSTRYGYGHINGVPVLHRSRQIKWLKGNSTKAFTLGNHSIKGLQFG